MSTIRLGDMLKLHGWNPGAVSAQMMRHTDGEEGVAELERRGWLETYQAYQSRDRLDGVDVVFSFIAGPGKSARFFGGFKVNGRKTAGEGPLPSDCPSAGKWRSPGGFFYDLSRVEEFEPLRGRLVVQWGNPVNWCVQLDPERPVLEILAAGRRLRDFEDYLDFSLSYGELQDLFKNPAAHRDWESALKAVAGVYLITAKGTNQLYVGSAYGVHGLWGRWADYAQGRIAGHGDDKKLKALLEKSPGDVQNFEFSILQILPKSMDKDLVIRREHRFMEKLRSRVAGLNS